MALPPSSQVTVQEDPVLPDDLVSEIFLRVRPSDPATLFRVAVGSKRWRSFICDPSFHQRYTTHHGAPPIVGVFFEHPNPNIIGYVEAVKTPPMADSHFLVNHTPLDFHHGLLLLTLGRTEDDVNGFLVWDPKTGEKTSVPLPNSNDRHRYSRATVLCATADCNHSIRCNGDDFQIVCVSEQFGTFTYAYMYSSVSDTWSDVISTSDYFYPGDPVLVDDMLYYTCVSEHQILRCSFRKELSLDVMPMPEYSPDLLGDVTLDELFAADTVTILGDGSLGVTLLLGHEIHIWSWKSDISLWVKHKIFDLTTVCTFDEQHTVMMSFTKYCPPGTILLRLSEGYYTIDLETERHQQLNHQHEATVQLIPYAAYFLPVCLQKSSAMGKKAVGVIKAVEKDPTVAKVTKAPITVMELGAAGLFD